MTPKFVIFIIVSVVFSSIHESCGQNEVKSFFYLGYVDGKFFFADTYSRSYASAGTFCNSNNMRIGEIRTASQQSFLQSKFDTATFSGAHWIGAQLNSSESRRNYYWNSSNRVEDFAPAWTIPTPTCLQYHAAAQTSTTPNGSWMSTSCVVNARSLCETDA